MRLTVTLGLMFMSSVSFAELTQSPSLSSLLSSTSWGLIRSDTTCIEHYKFSNDSGSPFLYTEKFTLKSLPILTFSIT